MAFISLSQPKVYMLRGHTKVLRIFDIPTSDTQVLAALSRGFPRKRAVSEIGTYLPSSVVGEISGHVSVSSRPRYIFAVTSITSDHSIFTWINCITDNPILSVEASDPAMV